MIKISLIKWIQKLSLRNKFSIIIGLMSVLLILGLGELAFGMRIISSIRAYVGGEGLWSKTQKQALNSLIAYSHSYNEADYQMFLLLLQVPLGDRQARLELEKPNPDLDIVRQGLILGRNDPADANDMIFLYQRFRHVGYMSQAIDIWAEADAGITEFFQVGNDIHTVIVQSNSTTDRAALSLQLVPLIEKVYAIDRALTILENQFSATLGEGSRHIRSVFFWISFALTSVFGIAALAVVLLIRKILVQIDTAKNEFISLASHQLKTPLTSIRWYSEMLLADRAGKLNRKTRLYVEKVWHNSERMVALINSLLNVSRIEMGTMAVAPELISFTAVASSVLEELLPQIKAKKLVITKVYAPDLPLVFADPQLMRIIFQNLLTNAIKYTPVKGVISVTIKKLSHGISIIITDSGCGIPSDQHDQIFTKLFRADNVRVVETDGSGLGLYIVKAIIDQVGGAIWFESKENAGTSFYITIPAKGMEKKAGRVHLN